MRTKDFEEALECTKRARSGGYSSAWLVLRKGQPSRPMRVVRGCVSSVLAKDIFQRTCFRMRQGLVVLVSPEDEITAYASEPMVRSRW